MGNTNFGLFQAFGLAYVGSGWAGLRPAHLGLGFSRPDPKPDAARDLNRSKHKFNTKLVVRHTMRMIILKRTNLVT